MTSRASTDPILDREKATDAAALYLAGADPKDPKASPLFSTLGGLAPVLIHVGNDEVLLDDSVRYTESMERVGGSVELHVWEGMLHVFSANIVVLEAAREAMSGIGEFLAGHLRTS
jgi:acetyl esterase/lipase